MAASAATAGAAAGAEEIKRHKWFRSLNWASLFNKQTPAPETPSDAEWHFDKYADSSEESGPLLRAEDAERFDGWRPL